jgi:hypothetical protein
MAPICITSEGGECAMLFSFLVQPVDHACCTAGNKSGVGAAGEKAVSQSVIRMVLRDVLQQHAGCFSMISGSQRDLPDHLLVIGMLQLTEDAHGQREIRRADEQNA